jgi:hypothetical protein
MKQAADTAALKRRLFIDNNLSQVNKLLLTEWV